MTADPVTELTLWKSAYEAAEVFFDAVNQPDELWTESREAFANGAAAYRDRLRRVLNDGVTQDGTIAVQRAVWILADPPSVDVTRVRDAEQDPWIPVPGTDNAMWMPPDDPDFQIPWPFLLADFGPITDDTPVGEAA